MPSSLGPVLLKEDGGALLQENGAFILLSLFGTGEPGIACGALSAPSASGALSAARASGVLSAAGATGVLSRNC